MAKKQTAKRPAKKVFATNEEAAKKSVAKKAAPKKTAANGTVANKSPAKDTVAQKPVTPATTAKEKAAKKKLPALKAAVRVIKKAAKPVKAKPAASQTTAQLDLPYSAIDDSPVTTPMATPLEYASLTEAPEPEVVAAIFPSARVPVSDDDIRHCAYLKWEAAGRPHGDGHHFWVEAERELSAR